MALIDANNESNNIIMDRPKLNPKIKAQPHARSMILSLALPQPHPLLLLLHLIPPLLRLPLHIGHAVHWPR